MGDSPPCSLPAIDENADMSSSHVASSPPAMLEYISSKKPKKPPPITPKRFTRFFTPRTNATTSSSSRLSSKSGRQLRDITRNGANRGNVSSRHSASRKRVLFEDIKSQEDAENVGGQTPRLSPRKRRKGLLTPDSSPPQSSPLKQRRSYSPEVVLQGEQEVEERASTRSIAISPSPEPVFPQPARRLNCSGINGRVVSRSFGEGRRKDHCASWEHQSSDFYSLPEYRHQYVSPCLPFCAASGHYNDLVAIGDESGAVTCINSTDHSIGLALDVKSHTNAVMDIAFSFDDALLASASGDQTVHLTDVQTSKQKFVLSGHISSVKQVRFQPGNPNMLATSSRDGSVQLWDLRCRAVNAAIIVTTSALATTESEEKISVPHLGTYSSIPDAHLDQDNKRDIPGRRGEVSITALAFLGHGRENMILTGSEASTSVRLWDIRGRYSQRRGPPLPLSSTELPDAHSSHRHYGINSILLNTDESRFYALSRDNTIYAYSTSHLVLGNAPELSSSSSSRTSKYPSSGKTGLGPIYGFRHQSFHATSFYVKAALRKATPDKFELIAVGSSDGCPVLFPTDERFLDRPAPRDDDDNEELLSTPQSPFPQPSTRPGLKRMVSNSSLQTQRLNDTIPIYEIGTPLIRGHEREVTSLAWTRRGELVSLGDDYTARVWNEGPQARELRVGGEAEGKRWGCGWASTREGFDDE